MSFFIINTEPGKMSGVEDSPYARMVAQDTRADLYEQLLLPLFGMSLRRFPLPTRIDEQLDRVAQYFALMQMPRQEPLTVPQLQAARLALTGFEQLSSYDEDDVEDLRRLARALSAAFKTQRNDDDFVREYRRVVQLQKVHKIATEEYLLNELSAITELLMNGNASIEELKQAHGEKLFVKVVNSADYLQNLTQLTEHANPSQLQLIWEHLGRDIRPDSQSQGLLLTSLHMLDGLWRNRPKEEGAALANAMKKAMAEQVHEWLKLVVNISANLPDVMLRRFYYQLVSRRSLDERLPFRDIVTPVCPDIVWYELRLDIRNSPPQQGVAVLERWVEHANQQRYSHDMIVQQGLEALRSRCTPEEWRMLAPKILTNSELAPLPKELEISLAKISLSALSLSRFSSAEVELCKLYRNNTSLPEGIQMVIGGILAMLSGQLDQDLASQLHQHFERVQLPVYQAEIEKFIAVFSKAPHIEPDSHSWMIWMLHTQKYNDMFWQSYWKVFEEMLTTPSCSERVCEVLAMWFNLPLAHVGMKYIGQIFLFMLPQTIEDARKVQGFAEAARKINASCAEQYQWYPLVQPYFSERKNMLTSIGQNLAMRFQKRNQNSEEAQALAQKQAFDAKVAALFGRKQIKASHIQYLPALYSLQQREQFWSAYWEGFSGVLVSRDADYALELLSFWFDDSFEDLERVPHVVHDFFLSLREVLEVVRKERGFPETAQQVHTRVARQRPLWYPLVQNFFLVQEKGQSGIGWLKRG